MDDLNDLSKLSSDYETVYEWKSENKTHKIRVQVEKLLHGPKTMTE